VRRRPAGEERGRSIRLGRFDTTEESVSRETAHAPRNQSVTFGIVGTPREQTDDTSDDTC